MKFRGRKIFKLGKLKVMIAGGISRKGQLYAYSGFKTKKGYSAGASIGTRGKQIYASANKRQNQARIKHNLTSGATQLRLKKKKTHY
jgi:hypothetical protein